MSVGGSGEKAQGEDKKKNSLHRVRPFGCGAVVVLGEPSPFRNCSSCFSSAASSGVFGLRASISVCSAGVNCGRWRTKATSFQLSSGVPSPPNAGEAGDEYVKVGTPPIRGILRKRSFVHSFDFQSRHFRKTGTDAAERGAHWHNLARLVDEQGKIVEFHSLGFSERDRIDLVALMAAPEHHLNSKRITDCFAVSFLAQISGSSGLLCLRSRGGTVLSNLGATCFVLSITFQQSIRRKVFFGRDTTSTTRWQYR